MEEPESDTAHQMLQGLLRELAFFSETASAVCVCVHVVTSTHCLGTQKKYFQVEIYFKPSKVLFDRCVLIQKPLNGNLADHECSFHTKLQLSNIELCFPYVAICLTYFY